MPLLLAFLFSLMIHAGRREGPPASDSWPSAGPPQLFSVSGLGNGYSSPVIAGDRLFITGEADSTGFLFSFDLKGKLIWKKPYGREWTIQFPGPRADPVAAGDLLYLTSGYGEIICLESETGKEKWSLDMVRDLGGIIPTFGYSVPAFIDGDRLFCLPGGEQNNIMALDRFTGKPVWSTPAKGETAGYGTPLLIQSGSRKTLVTATEYHILGLDAGTGELLWSYELAFKGEVPCNTPVFDGKNIFWTAGPGNGAVAATQSPDDKEITILWKNIQLDTFFGDFVKSGNHIFGSSDGLRKYISVDATTGSVTDSLSFGIGSVIRAGDMLIAYNQRGQVGLISYDGGKMKLAGSFRITKGTKEHFSHPVYYEGILFIRHGDVLLAFNLAADEPK